MNLDLTQEQQLIVQSARDFATRVLAPAARRRDEEEIFPVAELGELARRGLLGVNVPSALGGSEAGALSYALAMMEIGAADASVSVTMGVTNMAAELICQCGTEAQKRAVVPNLVGGASVCGAFALSEVESGSDPGSMRTRAVLDGDTWVINGTKQWITSGTHAGLFVVWARTGDESGSYGLSAFLVPQGTPGLSVGKPEEKMGLHGSTTVPLAFDNMRVPKDAILGQPGDGFKIAMNALDGGRIGIAAQATGIATAALEQTVRYVKERVQFGVPLAQHQAIQMMLADMQTWRDAARLLCLRAAWLKDSGLPFAKEAAMAKLFASEKASAICHMAVQIHGGYGYTREFPVERFLRDVRVAQIYEGTSEVQRMVIARALGRETRR